jgi:hypothetical protein
MSRFRMNDIAIYMFRRDGNAQEASLQKTDTQGTSPPDIVQDSTSSTTMEELEKLF